MKEDLEGRILALLREEERSMPTTEIQERLSSGNAMPSRINLLGCLRDLMVEGKVHLQYRDGGSDFEWTIMQKRDGSMM